MYSNHPELQTLEEHTGVDQPPMLTTSNLTKTEAENTTGSHNLSQILRMQRGLSSSVGQTRQDVARRSIERTYAVQNTTSNLSHTHTPSELNAVLSGRHASQGR